MIENAGGYRPFLLSIAESLVIEKFFAEWKRSCRNFNSIKAEL